MSSMDENLIAWKPRTFQINTRIETAKLGSKGGEGVGKNEKTDRPNGM